jgi:hypothetical protein
MVKEKKRRRLITKYDGMNVAVNERRRRRKTEYPIVFRSKTKETTDLNNKIDEDDCLSTREFDKKFNYFNLSSGDIDFISELSEKLSISYSATINLVLRDALNMFKSNFFYIETHYDNLVKRGLIKVIKE